jgi:hypothetical protein
MTEFIPYLAGLVTLIFGIGFYLGLQEFKKMDDNENTGE